MGGKFLMEWCCKEAAQSMILDLGCNLNNTPEFFLSADSNTDYKDEIIQFCPFCGKKLAELLK